MLTTGRPEPTRTVRRSCLVVAILAALAHLTWPPVLHAWQTLMPSSGKGWEKWGSENAVWFFGRSKFLALNRAGDTFEVIVIANGPSQGQDDAFLLTKHSGATGAQLWRRPFIPSASSLTSDTSDEAVGLQVDSAGDVFLAHNTSGSPLPSSLVKLSGATGHEIWRHESTTRAFALDRRGDVLLLTDGPPELLQKLRGVDGTEAWHHELAPNSYGRPIVAVDDVGDAVIGYLDSVLKIAGDSGQQVWRSAFYTEYPLTIDIDAAHNVIVSDTSDVLGNRPVAVHKLAAADGALLWSAPIVTLVFGLGDPNPSRVAIAPSGDVIVASPNDGLEVGSESGAFTVVRLDAATGAEQWRQDLAKRLDIPTQADAVALDPAGDVYAAGFIRNAGTCDDFTVVKLAGGTGDRLDLFSIDGTTTATTCRSPCDEGRCSADPRHGTDLDRATILRVDAQGNVLAAGGLSNWRNGRPYFDQLVVKLSDRLSAATLEAKTRKVRQSFRLVSKDANILAPAHGNPGDPTREGARLELLDPATESMAEWVLPARGWHGRRAPGTGLQRYTFVDDSGQIGSCRKVVVQSSSYLRAQCTKTRTSPVADPGTRTVTARLHLGMDALNFCLAGTGAVTGSADPPRTDFVALDTPPPPSCE